MIPSSNLKIVPLNMRWIESLPEEHDRCLHGEVKIVYDGKTVYVSHENRTINVTRLLFTQVN